MKFEFKFEWLKLISKGQASKVKMLLNNIDMGAVHKRRQQLKGGGVKNWSKLTMDNCRLVGGGCQKSVKNVDVVYGWSHGPFLV